MLDSMIGKKCSFNYMSFYILSKVIIEIQLFFSLFHLQLDNIVRPLEIIKCQLSIR